MKEVLSIGPFMIRTNLLLLIVSGMAGYYVMNRMLKQTAYHGEALMDKVSNSLLLVIAGWKLSPMIYNPSLLWENPFALLLANGPAWGIWLGAAIGIGYLSWGLKRMPIPKT